MQNFKGFNESRREVLQMAVGSLMLATGIEKAALGAAEKPSPHSSIPPAKKLGYAIVGLGKLSLDELVPAFKQCKLSKLVALVSGSPSKAAHIAEENGIPTQNIYNYQNYDRLKDNSEVDVIYIVLPNNMHAEYTIRGAQAGKHILCEKPMANSVTECQSMIEACQKAGRKLMIAYRMQYEPYNRSLIDLTRKQILGKTKLITADNSQQASDPKEWRLKKAMSGGGPLPDIGIYCLNAARYLTGEEPNEVWAKTYTTPTDERFKEVEETMSFGLSFPSRTIANCSTSYGVEEVRRYRVMYSEGWAELDPAFAYRGLRMNIARLEDGHKVISEHRKTQVNQFANEIDHMSECVMQNKIPHTPGEEGLQDMRIIEALYRSAREGKSIKLPTLAGLDLFRGPIPKNELKS